MPLACVANNWIEIRSDSAKICFAQRRPIPLRDDCIGPWLDNISFLTWLGTITTATLILLFRGNQESVFDFDSKMVISLLGVIFLAEHGYWIVDRAVGSLVRRMKTKDELKVLRDEYILRRKEMNALELNGVKSAIEISMEDGWRVSEDQPVRFWKRKPLATTIQEAKGLLLGKKDLKVQ